MASSIPGALTHFIALMTAALPATTDIWFGKTLGAYTAPLTLQISSIEGDQQPAELGPNYRREETYSMMCCLTSWAGDDLFVTRLSEVMTAFATIETTIGNNPTLPSTLSGNDGAVRYAEVGDFIFTPDAIQPGESVGELTFAVRCTQRVTSLT